MTFIIAIESVLKKLTNPHSILRQADFCNAMPVNQPIQLAGCAERYMM